MEIKWLRKALNNLDKEAEYLAEENPEAARQFVSRVFLAVGQLEMNPNMGVVGRVPQTRELVLADFPYIIPYRVRPRLQRIEILRIFHTSRKPPKSW